LRKPAVVYIHKSRSHQKPLMDKKAEMAKSRHLRRCRTGQKPSPVDRASRNLVEPSPERQAEQISRGRCNSSRPKTLAPQIWLNRGGLGINHLMPTAGASSTLFETVLRRHQRRHFYIAETKTNIKFGRLWQRVNPPRVCASADFTYCLLEAKTHFF